MLDPDLQKQLDLINSNLVAIQTKKNPGIWRAFFNGMFGALGYVAGLVIVLVIIGWILQQTGLWTPIQNQLKSFGNLMQAAEKLISPPNGTPSGSTTGTSSTQNASSGGEGSTLITLPNGQQVRVNLPPYNTNQ